MYTHLSVIVMEKKTTFRCKDKAQLKAGGCVSSIVESTAQVTVAIPTKDHSSVLKSSFQTTLGTKTHIFCLRWACRGGHSRILPSSWGHTSSGTTTHPLEHKQRLLSNKTTCAGITLPLNVCMCVCVCVCAVVVLGTDAKGLCILDLLEAKPRKEVPPWACSWGPDLHLHSLSKCGSAVAPEPGSTVSTQTVHGESFSASSCTCKAKALHVRCLCHHFGCFPSVSFRKMLHAAHSLSCWCRSPCLGWWVWMCDLSGTGMARASAAELGISVHEKQHGTLPTCSSMLKLGNLFCYWNYLVKQVWNFTPSSTHQCFRHDLHKFHQCCCFLHLENPAKKDQDFLFEADPRQVFVSPPPPKKRSMASVAGFHIPVVRLFWVIKVIALVTNEIVFQYNVDAHIQMSLIPLFPLLSLTPPAEKITCAM